MIFSVVTSTNPSLGSTGNESTFRVYGTRARILSILGFYFFASCGAPTKTAKSVSDQLNAEASDRIGTVCARLINEERELTKDLKAFAPTLCSAGIARRQLLSQSPSLALDTLDRSTRSIGATPVDKVIDLSVTSTVQFGISFAQFAAQLGKAMKEAQETGKPLFDPSKKPSGTGSFQDLIEMETIERKKIEIDPTSNTFSGAVDMVAKAIAPKVNLALEINGKILEDSVAVRFRTNQPKPFAESLLESLTGLILLVPYDNDVIAFLYLDVGVHDLGIGEQSMARQISQSIGSSFQTVFDGLAQINR